MKKPVFAVILALLLSGCAAGEPAPSLTPQHSATPESMETPAPSPKTIQPQVPEGLHMDENGEPILKVYVTEKETLEEMPMETYLQGVLAGEMKNDWPMEALKAQAIIARTFAMRFIEEKGGSQLYEGADVSTDVNEAQAYDAAGVNERIVQAIEETRGMVMGYEGSFAYTWFHSHSGGRTALPAEGLEWDGEALPYIESVESEESQQAPPEFANWTAVIPVEELRAAVKAMGFDASEVESIKVGETGPSGRVVTFQVGQQQVSAPSLRLRLGAELIRSTLIEKAEIKDGAWHVSGKGFGHGVGMSQWGAYLMAEQGETAEEILSKYYREPEFFTLW